MKKSKPIRGIGVVVCIIMLILVIKTIDVKAADSVENNYSFSSSLSVMEQENIENIINEHFTSSYQVSSTQIIKDINGNNQFVLIEFNPSGYCIYDRLVSNLCEFTMNGHSPYYGILSEKIYVAPTYYYYKSGNDIYDVMTGSLISSEDVDTLSNASNYFDSAKLNNEVNLLSSTRGSLIPSGYVLPAQAEVSNAYYFENAHIYHQTSLYNTCGYEASSMVFGYYDNFCNENLIPENYEVRMDETTDYSSLSNWTESPGSTMGFGNYLYDIGKNNLSYPDTGLNMLQLIEIVEYYFEMKGFSSNVFDTYYTVGDSQNIKYNNVKYLISIDMPVIINIDVGDPNVGHAIVAYSYDSNWITCNYGTPGGDYASVNISGTYIYWAVGIDFYAPHVHSDNYYYGYTSFCGCGYNTTESHTHEYSYVPHNWLVHKEVCDVCIYNTLLSHTFTYAQLNTYDHVRTCSLCGYSDNDGHDCIYTMINGAMHHKVCKNCNYSGNENHVYEMSASGIYNCIYCDYESRFVILG